MNYLAHLYLADDNDASRIGNLLGDFTRGPISELEKIYPGEVVRGIRMHRAVDRFTDDHILFKEARQLLIPERRRFAGIVVDIFFDYFLCIHWKHFSNITLETFITEVYQALEKHPEWRAGRLKDAFPMMRNEDWLARYASIDGISNTLHRVSMRGKRLGPISAAAEDLRNNLPAFDSLFQQFMPALITFVKNWKQQNPSFHTSKHETPQPQRAETRTHGKHP